MEDLENRTKIPFIEDKEYSGGGRVYIPKQPLFKETLLEIYETLLGDGGSLTILGKIIYDKTIRNFFGKNYSSSSS